MLGQVDKMRYELLRNVEALEKDYPSIFWIPNIAQERALRIWDGGLGYPFISMCTFANGTGKTNAMVMDLAGTLLGGDYVNRDYLGCGFYDSLDALRLSGKLRTRIVCDSEDIRENGSVWSEIRDWLPSAEFRNRSSTGAYKQVAVPVPGTDVWNFIDVKTFDQAVRAHSGSNLHRIWINEPPPENVFAETVGRTRSKKGGAETHILLFATVLDEAGYLFEYLESDDFRNRTKHLTGSTWENCVGEDIPDEVGKRLGLKPLDGGGYLTRGVLTGKSIRNMISAWERSPGELEARLYGLPMNVGGTVWKNFRYEVHTCKDYPVPSSYPVIQVVDPHDAYSDLSAWFMITPTRRLIAVAEYPHDAWERMRGRGRTISETCDVWRDLEQRRRLNVVQRFGDPNKFKDPDPNTLQQLYQLYSTHGFDFNLNIKDDLDYGHRLVEDLVWYDVEAWNKDPDDKRGKPRLMLFESCKNLIKSCQKYGYKAGRDGSLSNRMDSKYKGGADLIRYASVALRTLGDVRPESMSDYDKVRNSRQVGKGKRKPKYIKGRRVLSDFNY